MACEDVCIRYELDYFDNPGRYDRDIVVAEVESKCIECGAIIIVGQQYERASGSEGFDDDDELGQVEPDPDDDFEWHTCLICAAIGDGFCCDGVRCHGRLWLDIKDSVFPDMTSECVSKVKGTEARTRLLEEWNKWKGLR